MTLPEITKKYIGNKTLEAFASELGIQVSAAAVHHWKEGNRTPEYDTLREVINSPTATDEAKAWAAECMEVRYGVRVGAAEPNLNQEIERRR
ncbi:MAG: hypothetical protein A2X80_09995 [Geobacteraceae bacterium GWB2_52_12]|nr:MAG: hypothetical protein A2X80_09995 [Geobacteraceae bacterium GWB2_52_12]